MWSRNISATALSSGAHATVAGTGAVALGTETIHECDTQDSGSSALDLLTKVEAQDEGDDFELIEGAKDVGADNA